jgi:carbon monoxide dehydrogenase subunit G
MKIAGSHILHAPRDDVWALILEPEALKTLIPGCQQLEQIGPDEFQGQIRVQLASVGGTYETFVRIVERDPPRYCRFEGQVRGPTGIMQGKASFALQEVNQETLITYEAEALVTGGLAKLSARFVEGVAKTLIGQGMFRLDRQLQPD